MGLTESATPEKAPHLNVLRAGRPVDTFFVCPPIAFSLSGKAFRRSADTFFGAAPRLAAPHPEQLSWVVEVWAGPLRSYVCVTSTCGPAGHDTKPPPAMPIGDKAEWRSLPAIALRSTGVARAQFWVRVLRRFVSRSPRRPSAVRPLLRWGSGGQAGQPTARDRYPGRGPGAVSGCGATASGATLSHDQMTDTRGGSWPPTGRSS